MADGILQRIPDLTPLLRTRGTTQTQLNALLEILGSMRHENEASPIAPVTVAFGKLSDKLKIDVSGLSSRLPSTIAVIQNALPADTLEYVESIENAYTTAQDFLKNTALAKAVPDGRALQEVALAVIEDALNRFNSRLAELTDTLLHADALEQVRSALAAIEAFQSDFPSRREEFLPFITHHLIGVSPGLLRDLLDHLNAADAVLVPLEPEALAAARGAIANACNGLVDAIESLEPAAADGYVRIQECLNEVETAITTMIDTLTPLYQRLQNLIESYDWDTIFSTYQRLLAGVTFDYTSSVNDVADGIISVLTDLIARLEMVCRVEGLHESIELLNQMIYETFSNALKQIGPTLSDFLKGIQQAIESVPIEQVQAAVEKMLSRVRRELDALGIDQIRDEIETAFNDVEAFVAQNINEALVNHVQAAVGQVLSRVQNLPIQNLISELTAAVEALEKLIKAMKKALDGQMDALTNLVSQLDGLSFKPVSDAVIAEIDELKGRLGSINPNALSDVEKIGLKAGLAALEAIDLESELIDGLKAGFKAVEDETKSLLNQLTNRLKRLREKLGDFDPEAILGPLRNSLEGASAAAEGLNATALFNPLHAQVDGFIAVLEAMSPGPLLDSLQASYDSMMSQMNRLNPDRWVAPLNQLYDSIHQLMSAVNVTPVLDELDRRQKAIFINTRDTILNALDSLDLPQALKAFFDPLRPVLAGITDAVLGATEDALKEIGVDLRTRLSVTSLFEPLDAVFNQLMAMLASVPQEELTDAMNTIRETIGMGLDAVDPKAVISRFREGGDRLAEIAPTLLLGRPLGLPELKVAFEAKAAGAPPERGSDAAVVLARFDAVFALVDPDGVESRIRQLIQTHNDLLAELRLKINALNPADVEEAYHTLRDHLERWLPEFLRRPEPLTHAEIIAELYSMRPAARAEEVACVLETFLEKIEPIERTPELAINTFFNTIRKVLMLTSPRSLKEELFGIYNAIRERMLLLNPSPLADSIRDHFFAPLTDSLTAIDPAEIKAKVDEAFKKALNALSTNVKGILDDIAKVIDEQLRAIRAAIRSLLESVKAAIQAASEGLKNVQDGVQRLVFVELLERLSRVIDNLGVSFDKELSRVRNAFDGMIAAIPV